MLCPIFINTINVIGFQEEAKGDQEFFYWVSLSWRVNDSLKLMPYICFTSTDNIIIIILIDAVFQ